MKPVTYIANFLQGMTSNVFTPNATTRFEHFDIIDGFLRPFRTLTATTLSGGSVSTFTRPIKFVRGNGVIYALGREGTGSPFYPCLANWNTGTSALNGFQSFSGYSVSGTAQEVLLFYKGKLYGMYKGTNLWEMTTAGVLVDNKATFSAITTVADPIIHSKDNLSYWFTDNLVRSFDGTTLSTVLTLPSTFIITSGCEQGDYINIVGYDSQTNKATMYIWDRDSSLATLTGKYELGIVVPYHVAIIDGVPFVVSIQTNNGNTAFVERPIMVIQYLTSDKIKIYAEFPFTNLTIGGKYVAESTLYFNANFVFAGDSSHWATFVLDRSGLRIAQNVGINDSAGARSDHPGLLRDGDGFWIGGGADGAWHSATTYTTISFYDTTDIRSENLFENIAFMGAVITTEPLPAGGQIVLQARKNAETSFTTLATFSTTNNIKHHIIPSKAMNALTGLDKAKYVRFRIQSTVGATITGFQAIFNSVPDQSNG